MNDLTKAILYTWAPITAIAAAAAVALAATANSRRAARRQRAWNAHTDQALALTKPPAAGGRGTSPSSGSRRPPPGSTPWYDSPCGCAAREQPREIYTCPRHAADQLINLEAMWQRREDAR